MALQISIAFRFRYLHSFLLLQSPVLFPLFKAQAKNKEMAHDNSSPLAGILMTVFFGIISTIIGVFTMYQVHNIWVKYHHRRHETQAAGALSLTKPDNCNPC